MKFSFTLILLLFSILNYSQNVSIPDAVFLEKLIAQGVDTNEDGVIQLNEALAVTHLNVNSIGSEVKIENMEGIQHFTNLVELRCANNLITSLDVTALTNLEFLHCNNNQITSLNITGLSQLTMLWARSNTLAEIDLSGLDNIWWIWVSNNNLNQIDLTGLNSLEAFEIANNLLSIIDFNPTPNLNYINVSGNSLTAIDFTPTLNLNYINVSSNFLSEIEVNHLTELESLDCHNNQIEEISISNLINLHSLYIGDNLIEEIDGSQNPDFIEIHCQSNPNLTYINMKNGAISSADPDMLYFGFSFYDTPELTFICMDAGEEYALSESGYNPNNVTISTTDCTMAISDVNLNSLTIYPNPVENDFHITKPEDVSHFVVLDISGKILFETSLYETAQKKIKNLKTGVYFLLLNDVSNNLNHFRFIKK
ncbi:leucine-rich repeat domain-containing protein [Planktosalinus lacus]|uniref:Secretion system C-terminal sorting domain-containing protein n=1 Tax=Planktosalinus lacus TaxID=1526573 RepID=A0A8J2V9N1_9FLAO|nr:leucine-rich repeat domain-containing protein [Planktosalinus lacus]GGD88594.1 hypothetical protein GCM10011312_10610 [Planktosalinus lacus]